jgi:5-methylcytosine-specific restriction endonuclease McrA
MGKRLEYTPNSKIKSALRQLFLRSRERQEAIKRDKYTCQICGKKQSKAKGHEVFVEVHHLEGVSNWQEIYNTIRKYLLTHPDTMQTLCKDCHQDASGTKKGWYDI